MSEREPGAGDTTAVAIVGRLPEAVGAWAARTPGAIAVTDRGRTLTYAQLWSQANRLARRLREAGVVRETMVGLSGARSADLVCGIVGILLAGGAYVPIDPSYPAERRRFLVRDAECPVVLADRGAAPAFADLAGTRVLVLEDPDDPPPQIPPPGDDGPDDALAYVIYTSGSTGQPKGVLVTHGNVLRLFEHTRPWFGFNAEDRWSLFHSFAFDFSVWEIWGALLHGGRVVIVPDEVTRDAIAFRALLHDEGVTILNQTPSAFRQLMRADGLEPRPDAGALRAVILGGEALDLRSLAPWFARHGDERPRVFNMYGITETTVHVTCRPITRRDAEDPRSLIGVPIPDLTLHLLDPEGRPVEDGEVGEIWVGGGGVARGYWRRPELTLARFVPDRFRAEPGARLYRSGDLARRSGGELEVLGRADQQVKLRGFRVELGEIDAALRAVPGVADGAVALHRLGDDEPSLIAYVVPRSAQLDLEAVRRALLASLPAHQCPSRFLRMDALPLTVNGKLDRAALPRPSAPAVAEGAPPRAGAAGLVGEIAALFGEVLGVPPPGPDAHFFRLGGSSLAAMRLSLRVAETLGIVLPPGTVFAEPTIAGLAGVIERVRGNPGAPRAAGPPIVEGWVPLSFAQEQLAILQSFAPESPMLHCPAVFLLRGRLDVERLSGALDRLALRHPILRTVFRSEGGRFEQRALPAPSFHLELLDAVPFAGPAASHPVVREALRAPFALERSAGRARLVRTGPDTHLLVLVLHHLITDGWSMARLLAELGAAHAGDPLPELRRSFVADALAQRAHAADGAERAWLEDLAGAPAVTGIPPERDRPARPTFHGALLSFHVGRERMAGLSALAREAGATDNTALFAGLFALVAWLSGERDLVLGVPYAGRDLPGAKDVQGPCMNLLALRVQVAPETTFRALVAEVRDRCAAAFGREPIPFGRLVGKLGVTRDRSRQPLVQVAFAPQPAPRAALSLEGLEVEPVLADPGKSPYDLTVYTWPARDGLDVSFEYATDLFSEQGMERVRDRWLTLLDHAAAHPDDPIERAPLLSPAERRHILEACSGLAGYEAALARPFVSMVDLFERRAAEAPGAEAIRYDGRVLTYGELDAWSSRVGQLLRARGVGAETLVAVAMDRSPELIASVLGIWKAGGAYLPLDPAYPAPRLAWMLADSGAVLLLTTSKIEPIAGCAVPRIELDEPASIEERPPPEERAPLRPEQLAYVIYTSGSTGLPKGAQSEHRGLANLASAMATFAPLAPGERELLFSSLSFDASIHELAAALTQGGALVIPAQRHPLAGVELLELLEAERITVALLPPSVLAQLTPRRLPALKTLITAGERCSRTLVDAWGAERAFHNGYGPTETSVCASWHRCLPGAAGDPPIGRPLPGATLYVLDEGGAVAPVGVPGELWIGGVGVGRGYLGRPELTAERFVDAGPLVGAPGKLYRTGDRARLRADDTFEFLGRRDDQHKIRGFRVELGEVESALLQHPEVQAAAVVVDGDRDEGSAARLLAYVVPRRRSSPAIELWPSVAEHFVYDELLYLVMSHDEHRNDRYRAALRERAAGKVVVDLGTGAEAILARLAVEAGARKVYAIELLKESHDKARLTLADHGLEDRIALLHADVATVALPELADVCVSELVGAIGGSEGVAYLLNHARRLLRPGGAMIPSRSLTHFAAVEVPDEILARPSLSPTAAFYTRKIFAEVGRPFDLRVCLRGIDRRALLSDAGVFEDLDFSDEIPLEGEHEVTLTIAREGRLGGLLVWLELFTTPTESLDVLDHQGSWIPVFLPLEGEPVPVGPGATLRMRVRRTLSSNGRSPDFHLRGELTLGDGRRIPLEHAVPHVATTHGGSAFYRRLWANFDAPAPPAASIGAIAARVRAFLRQRLPAHLVPSDVVELASLPLTPNGKLDRAALPRPASDAGGGPPANASETLVASIWREVLGREVGRAVRFFDAGGTSLLIVEVQARLEAAMGRRVPTGELFAHPTIAAMATLVSGHGRDLAPAQRRAEERAALARMRGRPQGAAKEEDR